MITITIAMTITITITTPSTFLLLIKFKCPFDNSAFFQDFQSIFYVISFILYSYEYLACKS